MPVSRIRIRECLKEEIEAGARVEVQAGAKAEIMASNSVLLDKPGSDVYLGLNKHRLIAASVHLRTSQTRGSTRQLAMPED
jgi:hypothetical protein